MKTVETPANHCPACQYKIDHATGTDHDEAPRPGDISICWNCATVLFFTDRLTVELVPNLDTFCSHPEVRAHVQEVQRRIRAHRRRKHLALN